MRTNVNIKQTYNQVTVLAASLLIAVLILVTFTDAVTANGLLSISPKQAHKLIQKEKDNPKVVIIDMRTPREFKTDHIANAILIDFYSKTFLKEMQALDKNKIYLIYCRSANRTTKALSRIKGMGFTSLYNMNKGIIGWIKEGFPINTEKKEIDSGIHTHPGTKEINMNITEQFKAMKKQKGDDYKPRTKHLDEKGWAKYTNRLFLESSPYLLQHAHNPVNWYPWGDEAFKNAKEKGLPVLLSVGYSTCHWCHVMEEESFEDIEIATYLNKNYIAIKVDREEQPDVDAIYMSAVQAITGQGGWPTTVWLTPDRKPFYGGTYFPARDGDRGASTGFLTLLQKIKETYDEKPDMIRQTSVDLTKTVQKMLTPEKGEVKPLEPILRNAIVQLKSRTDKINGGILGAPKFPSTMPVRLLLRYYRRTQDKAVLEMAKQTLTKMAMGGIYDQIGGGFHRYSTDEKWLVPHFEKMLYDNALLVMAYLEGYQVTSNKAYKQVVDETLLYVKREMTAPGGGFYSATDADSLTPNDKNEEGYYFSWTPQELETILSKKDTRVVSQYFDITEPGNFEGRSILNIKESAKTTANKLNISEDDFLRIIADAKLKLYAHRQKRLAPLRDEKILTAWNGLMISAFARSGLLLNNPDYIQTAKKAAGFIIKNLYKNKELLRSFKDGMTGQKAYLDDYAFLIAALLDLFEADPDPLWFKTALELDKFILDHFEDKIDGGYFMTADNHEKMIAREKPGYDGAIPSGNAIAVMNLLRLYEFTGNDLYRKRAINALAAFSKALESNPLGLSEMMLAIDFSLDSPKGVVIVFSKGNSFGKDFFLKELRKTYLPNKVLIQVEEGEHAEKLAALVPIVEGRTVINGKSTAYVCENGICQLPSFTAKDFARQIKAITMLDERSLK